MSKVLFIVESPNKIKTLNKILPSNYIVVASVGHIRSIPHKGLNIDVNNNFEPVFEISYDKKDVVKKIKEHASKADEIILATDEDREGEAIAWHIYELFNKSCQSKCKRVTFDSITKSEVEKSLKKKRDIDMDLVYAQHARQILDRLVGYKISPILWFSVKSGTSAGRVQSIALKIVCEREKEIQEFKPTDFWYIDAILNHKNGEFSARAVTKDKDNRYLDEKLSDKDLKDLKKSTFMMNKVDKKEKKSNPYPPFDTPSMLQAATAVYKWPVKKTTAIAQKLYEQGLLTYIRTDSYNISPEAISEVRSFMKQSFDKKYIPEKPNIYKKKSKAASQEAHECIRPTDSNNKGDNIFDSDEKKLYTLVWKRFVASQMTPMILDTVTYSVKASCGKNLIAKGQTVKFDGWSKVYSFSKTQENELPYIEEKEKLDLKDIKKTKHTTQPPPRYNEASLVKKLESEGIGRPSTYSSIMESIKKRGYVDFAKGKSGSLSATELGMQIFTFLDKHFNDFIMDMSFTANMEDDLGLIASGKKNHLEILQKTYEILMDEIKKARSKDNKIKKDDISTGEKCSVCKKGFIVQKSGKFGDFFACNQYPKCKTVFEKNGDDYKVKEKKSFKKTGKKCPQCKKGDLIERKNKRDGNIFYGCSSYPKCKYTEATKNEKDLMDV